MIVELRAVPDCPNLRAVREVLNTCLADANLDVTVIERIGDYPSPSILINGRDITGADPDGPPVCVLRPPTADQVENAIRSALAQENADDDQNHSAPLTTSESGPSADPIRADRPQRAMSLPASVRAAHQRMLRHFAASGTMPTLADLGDVLQGTGVDPASALRLLAQDDLVALDQSGQLVAAYPFSPTATSHVVHMDGVRAYAMCAIDALGIPAMLDRDVTITSIDALTGQVVTVMVADGTAVFNPQETVVVYAATGESGPSVDTCCSTINFFASTANALAWIDAHPNLIATILDQADAIALGREIFGPLLLA